MLRFFRGAGATRTQFLYVTFAGRSPATKVRVCSLERIGYDACTPLEKVSQMRMFWGALGAIVIAVLLIRHYVPSGEETIRQRTITKATMRVEVMMKGWKDAGTSAEAGAQEAACEWYAGKRAVSERDELEKASDGFDRWRRKKQLYRSISTYSVSDTELVEKADQSYTKMKLEIDGKTYRISVPDGEAPITWID